MLCETCEQLDLIRRLETTSLEEIQVPHHKSYDSLETALANGCMLCIVFHDALLKGYQNWVANAGYHHWPVPDVQKYHQYLDTTESAPFSLRLNRARISFDKRYSLAESGALYHVYERAMKNPSRIPSHLLPEHQRRGFEGHTFAYRTFAVPFEGVFGRLWAAADAPSPYYGRRPISLKPDFELCLHWVKACSRQHSACGTLEARPAPTRLIDIGERGECQPHLVVSPTTVDGTRAKVQYVTLSHCWGGYTSVMTTITNYNSHLRSLPMESLPRTYRDAVEITKELGFRYLWIDSLCIIQGDQGDWEIECAQMDAVYGNCVLTIAGPDSVSPQAGILHARQDMGTSYDMRSENMASTITVCAPRTEYPIRQVLGGSALGKRGWVFQERLLSPRVLCFGQAQLYYECRTHECSEQFWFPSNPTEQKFDIPKHVFAQNTLLEPPYIIWTRVVEAYSDCNLTFQNDKLPALSGLARCFRTSYLESHDKYIAGLWQSHLPGGLDWSMGEYGSRALSMSTISGAPSWSWASVDTPVSFGSIRFNDLETDGKILHSMQIMHAESAKSSQDAFGRVTSAFLEVESRMLELPRQRRLYLGYKDPASNAHRDAALLYPDDSATLEANGDVTCLLLWQAVDTTWVALAIVPVPGLIETYRRVGIARDSDLTRSSEPVANRNPVEWASIPVRRVTLV